MHHARRHRAHVAIAALLAAAAGAQSLVPAGTINDVVTGKPAVVVAHDDPAVKRYAAAIRDRFFPKAALHGEKDLPEKLAGASVIVYATPEHPWFETHREALPFTIADGVVRIDGREFRGKRLRVITAMRNPDDQAQRVVLYAAVATRDLVDINNLFHGSTEWLVADGDKQLGAGSYVQSVQLAPPALQQDLDALLQTVADVHPAALDGLPAGVTAAAAAASSHGDILSFTLPNSGLSYTVSFKRWIRPDPARDPAPCVVPDVAIPRTRTHVRDGTDPVLEWLRGQGAGGR